MDNFTVSPVVEQTLAELKALPCVKTSLDFLKTDGELTLEQQIAMAKIPAPTFHEREKALVFCEHLKELGPQTSTSTALAMPLACAAERERAPA